MTKSSESDSVVKYVEKQRFSAFLSRIYETKEGFSAYGSPEPFL